MKVVLMKHIVSGVGILTTSFAQRAA